MKANRKKSLTALQSDTIKTLKELHKRGMLMGILSNTRHSRKDMHQGLVKSSIKKYFEFEIYSSDTDVVCGKPCGEIFDAAWKIIRQIFGEMGERVRKKQVLYVGDNYYSDVMGARNFGFKTAYITNAGDEEYSIRRYLAELFGDQDVLIGKLGDLIW